MFHAVRMKPPGCWKLQFCLGASLLAIASGCGAHAHARLGTRAEVGGATLPRVTTVTALPEPCRDLDVVIVTATARGFRREQAQALGTGVRDALARSGLFDRVTLVEGATGTATLRLEIAPAAYQVVEEAGADSTAAIVGYLFLGPWSNWFHDRRCGFEVAFAATLRDRVSGRELRRLPRVRGRAVEEVSFWERRGGFAETLATIAWFPPMGFDTDPARIEALFAGPALERSTGAVIDAVGALRVRAVEGADVRTYPLVGLEVTVTQPIAGSPKPVQTTVVRLQGPKVSSIETVWIGDRTVYDASSGARVAPSGTELIVGRQLVKLDPARTVLVVVKLAGAAPVAVAEIGSRKTWTLAP
jgi:hypothetical protein